MSKSKKKQKANVNKGYPRWVGEKYRNMSNQDFAVNRVQPMTENSNEHEQTKQDTTSFGLSMAAAEQVSNASRPDELDDDTPLGDVDNEAHAASSPVGEQAETQAATSPSNQLAKPPASQEKLQDAEKFDKRSEPQNVAEFIDAFLAGKAKSLSEATARRIKGASPSIDPSLRGELLRRAQEVDGALDKSRKLMLLAKELSSHKALTYTVIEFCVDCVLMNPFVQSEGMRPVLFPGHHDACGLDDAWKKLQALALPSNTNPKVPDVELETTSSTDKLDSSGAHVGQESGKANAKGGAAKAAAQRSVAALASRVRRNALLCSAIWRVQQEQVSFPEVMRTLRATLFSLKKRPDSLEDELLEAIASLPEKEDERVAYLLEWSARQQTEAMNKFADASRQAEALSLEVDALKARLASSEERVDSLQGYLERERNARAESEKALGVAETHGQADLEELRALSLKALRDAVSQLDVVSEALKRVPPKVESALDKVDAVMDALKTTNKKLEDA